MKSIRDMISKMGRPRQAVKKTHLNTTVSSTVKQIIIDSSQDPFFNKIYLKNKFSNSNLITLLVLYYLSHSVEIKAWIKDNKESLRQQI